MIGQFLKSMIEYVKQGHNLSQSQYNKRLVICEGCDRQSNWFCKECGCSITIKARLSTEECPLKKWPDDSIIHTEREIRPIGECLGCGS